jgi:hypothetical protein
MSMSIIGKQGLRREKRGSVPSKGPSWRGPRKRSDESEWKARKKAKSKAKLGRKLRNRSEQSPIYKYTSVD